MFPTISEVFVISADVPREDNETIKLLTASAILVANNFKSVLCSFPLESNIDIPFAFAVNLVIQLTNDTTGVTTLANTPIDLAISLSISTYS